MHVLLGLPKLLIDALNNKHTLQYVNKHKQNTYQIFKIAAFPIFSAWTCTCNWICLKQETWIINNQRSNKNTYHIFKLLVFPIYQWNAFPAKADHWYKLLTKYLKEHCSHAILIGHHFIQFSVIQYFIICMSGNLQNYVTLHAACIQLKVTIKCLLSILYVHTYVDIPRTTIRAVV